jgi:hypothetical protein
MLDDNSAYLPGLHYEIFYTSGRWRQFHSPMPMAIQTPTRRSLMLHSKALKQHLVGKSALRQRRHFQQQVNRPDQIEIP